MYRLHACVDILWFLGQTCTLQSLVSNVQSNDLHYSVSSLCHTSEAANAAPLTVPCLLQGCNSINQANKQYKYDCHTCHVILSKA